MYYICSWGWVVFNLLIRLCTGAMANVLVISPRLRCLPGFCFECVRGWVQSGIEAPGGTTCARDLVRYVLCATCNGEIVGYFFYYFRFCGTHTFGVARPAGPGPWGSTWRNVKLTGRMISPQWQGVLARGAKVR